MRLDVFARLRTYAAGLRFPRLVAITAALLAVDILIPDAIPFADEILLALITALLGSIKKKRGSGRETPPG
jgi:hypothetical protein